MDRSSAVAEQLAVSSATGGPLKELASGIDALYMSGQGECPETLLSDLEAWRSLARESEAPTVISLMGEFFRVGERAWGKYPYFLEHENGLIGFTDSTEFPALRIQPRTEQLHSAGPHVAIQWWQALAEGLIGDARLNASRMDLYSDWQGWDLKSADSPQFLSRARNLATYEESGEFTGFTFGRRKTQTILARIYDKSRDIERKNAHWWFAIWGERYDPQSSALRVEFELGRQGLRDYGIHSASEALEASDSLWAAVTSWLTHRVPTQDNTPARWPISPQWQQIQQSSIRGDAVARERIRLIKKASSLRSLMPGLAGYLSSYAALIDALDMDSTFAALPGNLRDYAIWTGKSFEERIAKKRMGLA